MRCICKPGYTGTQCERWVLPPEGGVKGRGQGRGLTVPFLRAGKRSPWEKYKTALFISH